MVFMRSVGVVLLLGSFEGVGDDRDDGVSPLARLVSVITRTSAGSFSAAVVGEAVFRSNGSSNFVSRKWPIWFVPSWISWPCGVVMAASANIPAFSMRISSLVLFWMKCSAASLMDEKSVRSNWIYCISTVEGDEDESSSLIRRIISTAFDSFRAAR